MQARDAAPSTEDRLRFLAGVLAPAAGMAVQRIETHMSCVLLGGERVLKLKKPVHYPFLDFSTVAAREHDTREELRLNRRLAPQVYLGVLALLWRKGSFSLAADDAQLDRSCVVDWLVEMRRLPAARMLDAVIAGGGLRAADIDALVELLAAFYRRAAHSDVSEDGYLAQLRGELAQDQRVLKRPRFGQALGQVSALLDRMERAVTTHEDLLRRRVREHRIVEGHGDLRPEHVCLTEPPVVIDALEFDLRLREVDPFDELAFLGLECATAGDPGVGAQLLARCADALDDHPPPALVCLYTARRALLRARLSAAHLLEAEVRTPQKWIPQAQRYLAHAQRALDAIDSLAG
ncbi:MAG TPA: hypothetical protein VJ743_02410 [Albitalea sp.]|nr:hypothetical protein [Albitalea sp.]